ncbi:hypothetical protein ACFC0D_31000 [Streptomyces sp. NPDC056222]|uniref:hypothetical protein n=1 Tax=Streptomyces sp. NPDC056222 TaxID=3345749 RepID=UPI0035D580AB
MSVDSTVQGLLRQIATQDFVELRDEMGSAKRLAVRAAVVEQYGFEYAESWAYGTQPADPDRPHVPRPPPRGTRA